MGSGLSWLGEVDSWRRVVVLSRPAGQPPLDAKKTSYKQVGKYIKHMHKQKLVAVRDVKNVITLLSVDRGSAKYTAFELPGDKMDVGPADGAGKEGGKPAGAAGYIAPVAEVDAALRTKPPVVTEMWQPNSCGGGHFEPQ